MKIIKKKTTILTTWEHEFPNGIVYQEERINDEYSKGVFLRSKDQRDDKNYKGHIYRYLPQVIKLAKKLTWSEIVTDKTWCYNDKIIDPETFNDFDNIVYFGASMDGVTWRILDDFPLSTPIHQGYIGGYDNSEWDIKKLYEYLKKRSEVISIDIVNIPWYNSDEGLRTKAVAFTCLFPQETYTNLFRKYKNLKNGYWMGGINDSLRSYSADDPLGIKLELGAKLKKE